jgi:N-acetylmuramic acid 6-phosphate etherase
MTGPFVQRRITTMSTERRNPNSVDIDLYPTERILKIINSEDATVTTAVSSAIPELVKVVDLAVNAIRSGGRMIYVGAGSSGRMAILDAAECPPTFSSPPEWVQAIIAGGAKAIVQAIEGAEDSREKAASDLKAKKVGPNDLIIGIAAGGRTPYTHAALEYARSVNAKTVAVVAAPDSVMAKSADIVIYTPVGPEVIAGSSRMKAGTSQKLVLNMISTATMIRLGMTYSNWMINVNMTNAKLHERGVQILREILGVSAEEAKKLSDASGGRLKLAVIMGTLGCNRKEAEKRLDDGGGNLRKVLGHLGTGRE